MSESRLPSEYVIELINRYQDMAEACLLAGNSIRADCNEYPLYMPTYGRTEAMHVSEAARDAAIESITRLFQLREGQSVVEAGLLCASAVTVKAISELNNAKIAFKNAVLRARRFYQNKELAPSRISQLIRDEVVEKGYRSEALRHAMGGAGIGSLDLKRCYAQIRILPKNLDAFSWTWATHHARILKLTVEEVEQMIEHLPKSKQDARQTARDLLSQCRPGESLARKIPLKNQLRANYLYEERGRLVRKACPISGVVIAQQKHMPRKLWRDNPDHMELQLPRLTRYSSIGSEPFIKVLDLYRYVR